MQDIALLTQYAQNGSEAAFSQLLARHLPLVFRTCRRELASDALAEDAAQVVFLLLARKAGTLRAGPSLAGWLYQTAVFVAKDIRKQEARRTRREEAVMPETTHAQAAPASDWDTIEPHLNAALSALKPADRDAVLLRFLEGHTLAETGTLLGVSEDAARMRVSRALEKLRRHLSAHGAAVTGVLIAALLTTEAARPVSAQAVSAVTQGTLQALATGPAPNVLLLSKGVSHTMKIIKIKYAGFAAIVLLGGIAIVPLTRAVGVSTSPAAGVPISQSTQDAFLLGLTQYDCRQRAEKLREDSEAATTDLHDPQIVAATFALMSLKARKVRQRQSAAYTQIAQLLAGLGAPAALQGWAVNTKEQLNAPLTISAELGAGAAADLNKPEYASVPNVEEITTFYGIGDETADIQNGAGSHQAEITVWLSQQKNHEEWTRELGELAAQLNFREVKPERGNPAVWPQTTASALEQTVPNNVPANVRQDLERVSALGVGSNPAGSDLVNTFDAVRTDLLKTYGVMANQHWPI